MPEVIDVTEKFALFSEHWRPKTIAELNGQEFKAVKIKGSPGITMTSMKCSLRGRVASALSFATDRSKCGRVNCWSFRPESNIGRWRMKKPKYSCWSRSAPAIQAISKMRSIPLRTVSKSSGSCRRKPES